MSAPRLCLLSCLLFFAAPLFAAPPADPCHERRIQVIYWSAEDCSWCQRWDSEPSLGPAFRRSPTFAKVDFRSVKKPRLAEPYVARDYPPELDWLRAKVMAGEVRTPRLVPAWSVFVDHRPIDSYLGTQAWLSRAVDDLRLLVQEVCR